MKINLCLIISLAITSNSIGQWYNLGKHTTNLEMVSNGKGYKSKYTPAPTPSGGGKYSILKTDNDWNNSVENASGGGGYGCCHISDMHFLNSDVGIRVIKSSLGSYFHKTINGGENWSSIGSSIMQFINDVKIVDDTTAFISTSGNYILKLNNNDITSIFHSDTMNATFEQMEFVNSKLGYVIMKSDIGTSYLLRLENLGTELNTSMENTESSFLSISTPSISVGFVSTSDGKLYKTENSGDTWFPVTSPTSKRINSIDFLTDDYGYIACSSGEIYSTVDGGNTWISHNLGTTNNLIKVKLVDNWNVYAQDNEGYLYKNLTPLPAHPEKPEIHEVVIIAPNPAMTSINVFIPSNEQINNIELFDAFGRYLSSFTETTIDVTLLESGVYNLIIYTESSKRRTKFVKTNEPLE